MRVQSEDRKQRLATALRKNLRRRKATSQGNRADIERCGEQLANDSASPEGKVGDNAERSPNSTC
jgi:hypothetical protein